MVTDQGGAEAEVVTDQSDKKLVEEELFIVQHGEAVSPRFTH